MVYVSFIDIMDNASALFELPLNGPDVTNMPGESTNFYPSYHHKDTSHLIKNFVPD